LPALNDLWSIGTWGLVDSVTIPYNARFIAVRENGTRLYVSEHSGNECYAFDVNDESLTYGDHLILGDGFVSMNLVVNEKPALWVAPVNYLLLGQ